MINKERLFLLGTIGILIIILLLKECRTHKVEEQNTMYNHLEDSTQFYKDKYNVVHATNTILQASSTDLLLTLKSSDSLITQLQNKVEQYRKKLGKEGSITVANSSETVHTTTTTTITIDSTKNATYTSNYKDKWIDYKIKSNKDTTTLDLEIKNVYTIVLGEASSKWYKKKQPFVDVSNENPYDKIKTVKAFQVKNTIKHRFSLGIQVGYGFSSIGVPKPYIGIGGQFNILNF